MTDTATLVYDIDSRAARTAASDLAKLNDASARAAGGADKLNKTLRDSQGRFRSSYSVAKEYGSEIRRLAAKYNPALNAVYQYQKAQLELNRAVALGVLTQGQADAALERTAAQLSRTGAAAGNMQAAVGNQFAQINDLVVTAWGGMNPALIGMQQGMQMVQGFAGQSVPQALNTLKGAFAQLLNPTTLLTVGLVAGGAALIQFGAGLLTSSSDAKTFKDAVDSAESAIDAINKASVSLSKDGLDELAKKYGTVNAEVRELVRIEQLLAQAQGVKALNEALTLLTDGLGAGVFNTAYGELERVFETTANNAQILYGRIERIGSLDSIDKQLYAVVRLRDELAAVTNNFQDMSLEQAEMLRQLAEAEKLIRQMKAAAGGLPAAFSAAAAAAAKITSELERAVNAAYRLANSAISDARFAQIELDFRTDDIGKAAALAAAKFDEEVGNKGMDQWLYNSLRQQAIDGAVETARILAEVDRRNEADRDAEKGGGGGAAVKQAEKQYQALRELLQEDTLFQYAEYEKRSAQLANARAKDLLTEQEYQLMKQQLQMLYFGSEYEQNAVNYQLSLEQLKMAREQGLLLEEQYLMRRQQLQHDYYSEAVGVNQNLAAQTLSNASDTFSQLNQLAGGGYDKLLKAQKVFASGSALINAYLAASQALADPTVPYWMKIAAYAKVLAAGMGAVNAIKGGGSGGKGGSSGASSAATTTTKAQPTQYVTIDVTGDSWARGLVEGVIEQIQQQTKDGRVVFMGNR